MNRRIISALFALALSFSPAIAGCGGDDSADSHAPTPTLSGVYRPLDAGAIGSITFSGSVDYLLMPSGCKSGACAEIGTYSLDVASNVLVLDDAKTHRKRSIALEILETTGGGSGSADQGSLVKSVAPLDLVDPGQMLAKPGQQTTTGGGQQLATSGNGTTGAAQQLLDLIKQLIMNGQQMKQDDQGGMNGMQGGGMQGGGGGGGAPMIPMIPMPNAGANPAPMMPAANPADCKQGVPTKDTPLAEVAAYFARCPGGP